MNRGGSSLTSKTTSQARAGPIGRQTKPGRAGLPSLLGEPRLQKALLRLHAGMEMDEVSKAVFDVFDAVVPNYFVAVCLQVVELEKPLIVRWSHGYSYDPAELKRFFEINPSPAVWNAHPGLKIWTSSEMFGEDWQAAPEFYRECVQPRGWHYGVVLGFWKGKRLLGVISAQRALAQGDFSPAEVRCLLRLHPYFDAALQRLDRLHAERNARAASEQLLRRLPLPTVLLDWDLHVVHSNLAARDSCALWNLGRGQARAIKSRADFRLPAVLLEKCRELKALWNGKMLERYSLASPVGHPMCHPSQPDLRANIHLVQRSTGSITKPIFRVDFEEAPAANSHATGAQTPLSLNLRLTRRERELMELICQGAANKEIASRLSLSVGTVKKELNTLYQKLEVHSRGQLMALMR